MEIQLLTNSLHEHHPVTGAGQDVVSFETAARRLPQGATSCLLAASPALDCWLRLQDPPPGMDPSSLLCPSPAISYSDDKRNCTEKFTFSRLGMKDDRGK